MGNIYAKVFLKKKKTKEFKSIISFNRWFNESIKNRKKCNKVIRYLYNVYHDGIYYPIYEEVYFYENGKRHNPYGPASYESNNRVYWYLEDKQYYCFNHWLTANNFITDEERFELILKYS